MRKVLLGLLLAGCAFTPNQRREETLVRVAREWNDDIRWARYEQAAMSMPRDEARLFMARVNDTGEDLVIADHEVTSITFAPGSEAATVVAKLAWYKRQDPTVRTTVLEEKWEFRDGAWVMTKQRRTRGDRFPLVTEPIERAAEP